MNILNNEKYLKIGKRIDNKIKNNRQQKDSDYYVRKVVKNTFNDLVKNGNIEDFIFMNEEKLNKKDYYIKLVVNIIRETNTNLLVNEKLVKELAKTEQGQIELIEQVSKFAKYLVSYESIDYDIKREMIEEVEDTFWECVSDYNFQDFKKKAKAKVYQVKRNYLHEDYQELGVEEHETHLLSYFDSVDFNSRQDLDNLSKAIYIDILKDIKNELIQTSKEQDKQVKLNNIRCIKGYLLEQNNTLNLSKSKIEELATLFYEMVEQDLFVK